MRRRASPRASLASCLWLLLAALASPAPASARESLRQCVGDAVRAARKAGARPLGLTRRGFLLTRDVAHHTVELPGPGCAGFLVAARRHGQDVQLRVYDPQGTPLGEDKTTDAHPYVQACVSKATTVHVSVAMLDGAGEYLLRSLWDAPPVLVGLQDAMADCVHAGLPRPAPADVGPPVLGAPMGQGVERLRAQLREAGYLPAGPTLSGMLPPQGREVRRVRLEAGRCYALAAVGDVTVGDVDLRVFSPGKRPSLLGADTTRRREAVAKLCAKADGEHLVEVRMYEGSGRYIVEPMRLLPTGAPEPPGMNTQAKLGFSEALSHLLRRGLVLSQHVWALLPPRTSHAAPFSVQGGTCYAFAAVGDPVAGPVELSLTDPRGNLIATDLGLFGAPIVYHCAREDGQVLATTRMREARRAETVLVIIARDTREPEFALR